MSSKFETPILFIIYKRASTSAQVMSEIAKIKPRKLYISQDGPKDNYDKVNVLKTRNAVLSQVNWECDLVTWFHDKNIGLTKHTPSTFEKFFKREDYMIYLEDDTLPNRDFFYFQKEMLEKYHNDERIFSINGSNLFPEIVEQQGSYNLSKICSVWGMGFWKRSWLLYKSVIDSDDKVFMTKKINSYFFNSKSRFQFCSYWKAIVKGFENWDVLFNYTAVKNNMYFLTPSKNLIKNIGINVDSSSPFLGNYDQDLENILPVSHPGKLIYNKEIDTRYFDKLMSGGWLRLWGVRLYLVSPVWLKNIIEYFTLNIIKRFY